MSLFMSKLYLISTARAEKGLCKSNNYSVVLVRFPGMPITGSCKLYVSLTVLNSDRSFFGITHRSHIARKMQS